MAINIITSSMETGETKVDTYNDYKDEKTNNEAVHSDEEVKSTKPKKNVETDTKPAKSAKEADESDTEDNSENEESNEEDDLSYLDEGHESEEEEDESDEEEDEDESDEEEKPVKKSGFKKRIDKLTKEKNDIKTAMEALKAEIESLKGGKEKVDTSHNDSKVDVDTSKKPVLDDFEDYDAFTEALTEWKWEQKEKEKADKAYKETLKVETDKIIEKWNEKVAKASKKYKDWTETTSAKLPLTVISRQCIMESDLGPDVVYYLFKNPEVAIKLSNETAYQQLKKISEIEGKISKRINPNGISKDKNEEKKVTNAPEPIKPLNKSSVKASKNPEDMSLEEYAAYRSKQK